MEVKKLVKIGLGIAVLVGIAAVVLYGPVHADYSEREDVQSYVDTLVLEHGFDRENLLALFSEAQRKDRILESIARPAERTLEWHEYRRIFLKEARINQGLEFWADNEAALVEAQTKYGVAPEVVVAIIGVETRYGRNAGGYRVLDALTTLAFDYPPRSSFFRKELTEYLLLAREEDRDPRWFKGSYAGAMGYGQFIPSSFRAYAVDFDADGLRDIWTNETDAVGSVANYFKRHGWADGEPVAIEVQVSGSEVDKIANESLKLKWTVGELEQLGVAVPALEPQQPAALYRMKQEDGVEYWLGLNNFYVITRYNRSRLYALAVHQLSQEILAGRAVLVEAAE